MRSAHELLCLAEDFDALASTASNPLAKAQWRTMAEDYRNQANELSELSGEPEHKEPFLPSGAGTIH